MLKFTEGPKTPGITSKTFEFLAEDIPSYYWLLLWPVNTFAIDTDEYYPMCYKVNDAKTFKIFAYYFALVLKSLHAVCILQIGSFNGGL